jgi:exodeoxyribonuclease VII small subunit
MAKKSDNFESMMNKLEEIADVMDKEQLTLEQSMKYYEDGIKLCNKLYKALSEAEGKIKVLIEGKEENFLLEEE